MSVIGDPRPGGQAGPAGDQRQAGEDGPAGDPRPTGGAQPTSSAFDPSEHTVSEVQDYLAGVGDDERDRVIQAEREGKGRASLIG